MEPVVKRPTTNRRRSAALLLLPSFFVATAAIVLAVVALDRVHSNLGDAGVLALALLLAGLLRAAIARVLGEQEPPPGYEDKFTVDGEPDWWPEFERRFADHAAAWRRGRRLS